MAGEGLNCDLLFLKTWSHRCPLTGRRNFGLTCWNPEPRGQTGWSRSVLRAMKTNFLLKMGLRGVSLAHSRGARAIREEREPYRRISMGQRTRKSEVGVRRLLPGPVYSISDKRTAKEFRVFWVVHESNSRLWVTNVQCRGMNGENFFSLFENHLLEYIM